MDACLEIDVGNTRLKWRRVAERGEVVAHGALEHCCPIDLVDAVGPGVALGARIGSVADADFDDRLAAALTALAVTPVRFAHSEAARGRLRSGYRDPSRMGVDRWLALVAASRVEDGAFAVLDAGSAITLDLVAADGGHLGGWILPGLQMMRRSLLADTAGVRFPDVVAGSPGPGRDTGEAVAFGTLLMARDFVASRMAAFRGDAGDARLFVTGGDGPVLASSMEGPLLTVPDLVLDGLAPVLG